MESKKFVKRATNSSKPIPQSILKFFMPKVSNELSYQSRTKQANLPLRVSWLFNSRRYSLVDSEE